METGSKQWLGSRRFRVGIPKGAGGDARADVPAQFAHALGLEHLMFETAEPKVFSWYIQNFGPEVNLFLDHSQIVQLETLRRGLWGTSNLWGRVVTFKE